MIGSGLNKAPCLLIFPSFSGYGLKVAVLCNVVVGVSFYIQMQNKNEMETLSNASTEPFINSKGDRIPLVFESVERHLYNIPFEFLHPSNRHLCLQ